MTAKRTQPQPLQLLAPARDADTAIAAIAHGADAVYIGAPAFGARSAATNTVDDIRRVVEAARPFGVKVFVTLNTILLDSELPEARALITELWEVGVDALIVQDPALLAADLPPIDLHASTQWNSDSVEKIEMLSRAGFSQIVVPREFSLEKIRQAKDAVGDRAELEVFVHGALCVSYSGGCHAGQVLAGRSANRGRCPQVCRYEFTLTDEAGHPVTRLPDGGSATRHWLSLADMNRLDALQELAEAGASSFKIEGRLKPIAYVKNVTAAYSRELDRIVAASDGRFCRASFGQVATTFNPNPARSFNRGFTRYFLRPADRRGLTSWATPKWVGPKVATVASARGLCLTVKTNTELHNGDGLAWFDENGAFQGFRVNRVENGHIFAAPGSAVPTRPGTVLHRNNDIAFESLMARDDTARRTIAVDFTLRQATDGRLAIDAADCRGCRITVTSPEPFTSKARSPQQAARLSVMQRLGDTIYSAADVDDRLGDIFVPASALTALRRAAIDALDRAWRITRPTRRLRDLSADVAPDEFAGRRLDYHANVANDVARRFYTDHGAASVDPALEALPKTPNADIHVMTTDYCLRRELGACLKTNAARQLPEKLFLSSSAGRLRLDFDCANCRMKIYHISDKHNK